jgi:hypothetical protein
MHSIILIEYSLYSQPNQTYPSLNNNLDSNMSDYKKNFDCNHSSHNNYNKSSDHDIDTRTESNEIIKSYVRLDLDNTSISKPNISIHTTEKLTNVNYNESIAIAIGRNDQALSNKYKTKYLDKRSYKKALNRFKTNVSSHLLRQSVSNSLKAKALRFSFIFHFFSCIYFMKK